MKNRESAPEESIRTALRLLQANEIRRGRKALLRLCKSEPRSFEARILAAFEFLRPREDKRESWRHLEVAQTLAPNSCEVQCLWIISTQAQNYEQAWDNYSTAQEAAPLIVLGSALLLLARLCISDLLLQVMLRPEGSPLDRKMIICLNKGAAQLTLRRHDEALQTFRRGYREAAKTLQMYEDQFHDRFSTDLRDRAIAWIEAQCLVGQALTLWDTGRVQAAEAMWTDIATRFPDMKADVLGLVQEE